MKVKTFTNSSMNEMETDIQIFLKSIPDINICQALHSSAYMKYTESPYYSCIIFYTIKTNLDEPDM
jgi:hypothetical protein